MFIVFRVLSAAYIAAIFLLADSPVVNDVATFNPYSLLHIPLYGILTLLLILSFSPQRKRSIDGTNSIDPIDSKNPIDPTDPTNPIDSINPTNSMNFWVSGIIALMVAIADEIHQAYIPERNASIIDVVLDFIGIILSILILRKIQGIAGWSKKKALPHRPR